MLIPVGIVTLPRQYSHVILSFRIVGRQGIVHKSSMLLILKGMSQFDAYLSLGFSSRSRE